MDRLQMQDEERIMVGGEEIPTHLLCVLVPLRTPTRHESFELHRAICKRDICKVVLLLQQGLDPSAPIQVAGGHVHNILTPALTVDSFTRVHKDHVDNMELTKLIIEAKADVNQPDTEGSTPLIFAIRSNFLQGVKVAITQLQPAAPTQSYRLDTTLGELVNRASNSAAGAAVIEKIEVQLSPPKDPLLTTEEQNLLGGAIMQIYEERLMAKGENLAVQEVRDQSVARLKDRKAMAAHYGLKIYLATTHSLLDTIPLEGEGNPTFAEVKIKLAERHPTRCSTRTQLLYKYSVLQDDEHISEYPEILEEGVLCVESPARAPTRTEGLMLHHALADRDKELVLQMLREGIHPGPLISSDDGSTHNLLQAALVGDFTHEGQAATDDPCPQLTRILIEARAEVDIIDDSGITPLILATTMEYPAGIQMLLSNRANPNLTDQLYEESPLHYAIQHNSETCVQLLLEGRANPLLSSETSEQLTPRELAEYRYRFRMCSQLIYHLLTVSR
eukprot:s4538_g6.t1